MTFSNAIRTLALALGVGLCLFGVPLLSGAATETFTIQTQVGSDVTAPTAPTGLTATPVSESQINLGWTAATDNFGVAGYQVFRDGTQVATTSLTTYADTSLAASTLYAYAVTAFDAAGNISSSSNQVATTTLTQPATSTPPSPPDEGGIETGYQAPLTLNDFSIVPEHDRVSITFTTSLYAESAIRWGRTAAFEDGYAITNEFRREHRLVITNLDPGTVYAAEITLEDRSGRSDLRQEFTFTTLPGTDVTAPANVMDFRAERRADGIELSWVLPADDDFQRVRIVSSDRFYPASPVDGYLVYEGQGSQALDRRPLQSGVRYYAAFVYDESGNVSSGAVTVLSSSPAPASEGEPDMSPPETTATGTTPDVPTAARLHDIEFSQAGRAIQRGLENVMLIAGEVTTISIPYASLPEHLKTVIVTLHHPRDAHRTFAFLLRVNPDQTAYEARIGGLPDAGSYPVEVELFDFKTNELQRATGRITVMPPAPTAEPPPNLMAGWLAKGEWWWPLTLILLALLAWLLLRTLSSRADRRSLGTHLK